MEEIGIVLPEKVERYVRLFWIEFNVAVCMSLEFVIAVSLRGMVYFAECGISKRCIFLN